MSDTLFFSDLYGSLRPWIAATEKSAGERVSPADYAELVTRCLALADRLDEVPDFIARFLAVPREGRVVLQWLQPLEAVLGLATAQIRGISERLAKVDFEGKAESLARLEKSRLAVRNVLDGCVRPLLAKLEKPFPKPDPSKMPALTPHGPTPGFVSADDLIRELGESGSS